MIRACDYENATGNLILGVAVQSFPRLVLQSSRLATAKLMTRRAMNEMVKIFEQLGGGGAQS
jgi:uncharacterized membrane protein YqgA involved in biofilm formation